MKLNAEKTQLLWLGTRQQLTNLTISQLHLVTAASSSVIDIISTASNLGVIFNNQLTMSAHVSAVCRTGFFQLRQLRTIRRSLTPDTTRALVQAFVSVVAWTTVTHFLPALPTCTSVAFSRYRTRRLVWFPSLVVTTTSRRSSRHCLWLQNLEPTTASPPTVRTVAIFIQAPAQDPPLPALVCWL